MDSCSPHARSRSFHVESARILSSPLEIPAEHKEDPVRNLQGLISNGADTSGVPFLTGSRVSQAQNERKPCTEWYREIPHQFCILNLVCGQSPKLVPAQAGIPVPLIFFCARFVNRESRIQYRVSSIENQESSIQKDFT